jgi:hypothetical protein
MHVLGAVHTYWAMMSVFDLWDNVWRVMHPRKERLYCLFCFPYVHYLVYQHLILNPFYECEVKIE